MESESEKGLWSFSSSGIHFWFSIIRCYYRVSMICMMRKSAKDIPISMLFWKWYGTYFKVHHPRCSVLWLFKLIKLLKECGKIAHTLTHWALCKYVHNMYLYMPTYLPTLVHTYNLFTKKHAINCRRIVILSKNSWLWN